MNLYIATSRPGLSYVVKQICAAPLMFIAYARSHSGITTLEEPLFREGKDMAEALEYVGRHAIAAERAIEAVESVFGGKR